MSATRKGPVAVLLGGRSAEREDFWSRAARQLLRSSIDLLLLSSGRATLAGIYEIIVSAPTDPEQLRSPDFHARAACLRCLRQGERGRRPPEQLQDWKISREAQDELSLASHKNAAKAIVERRTTILEAFREAAKGIPAKFEDRWGKGTFDRLKAVN